MRRMRASAWWCNRVAVAGSNSKGRLDTGFIVHNERTYPHLLHGCSASWASPPSFGVRCEECGLEYAGARGRAGVATRPSKLASPEYLRMLVDVQDASTARRARCCATRGPIA